MPHRSKRRAPHNRAGLVVLGLMEPAMIDRVNLEIYGS